MATSKPERAGRAEMMKQKHLNVHRKPSYEDLVLENNQLKAKVTKFGSSKQHAEALHAECPRRATEVQKVYATLMHLYVSWKERRERLERQAMVIVPPYLPTPVTDLSSTIHPEVYSSKVVPVENFTIENDTLKKAVRKYIVESCKWIYHKHSSIKEDGQQDDVEIPLDLACPRAVVFATLEDWPASGDVEEDLKT
ncbi:hypothetical protein B7463_g1088, partial [Scytalidium lignicola]